MNQKYTKKSNLYFCYSFIILLSVALFHELQARMSLNDLLTPDILIYNIIYEKKRKDKNVTKIWDIMIRLT